MLAKCFFTLVEKKEGKRKENLIRKAEVYFSTDFTHDFICFLDNLHKFPDVHFQ